MSTQVFSGVKIAFIDQKLKTLFSNSLDLSAGFSAGSSKVDIDAYGVYIGAEGVYTTCGCFGLYGRASYGLLVADISRKLKSYSVNSSEIVTDGYDLKDDCWETLSNVNLSLGVNCELKNCFCVDWTASAGYEFQYWLGLTDFLNNVFERNTYNLGFDGLTVRIMASF